MDSNEPIIEAILFYETDGITIDKISKFTGLPKENVSEVINSLIDKYKPDNWGIEIVEDEGEYSFQIKKSINLQLKKMFNMKDKGKLSNSLLTVLSIIAYKQPITKLEIENIRGVASDNAVKTLIEKNLIKIIGRKEVLGRPLLYGTTDEFLSRFNLTDIKDLPQLNELKSEEFELDEDD